MLREVGVGERRRWRKEGERRSLLKTEDERSWSVC
jgi:hypothetical protein